MKGILILASMFLIGFKAIRALKVDVPVPEEYVVEEGKKPAPKILRSIASAPRPHRTLEKSHPIAQPEYRINEKEGSAFKNEGTTEDRATDGGEASLEPSPAPSADHRDSRASNTVFSNPARSPASAPAQTPRAKAQAPSSSVATSRGGVGTYTTGGLTTSVSPKNPQALSTTTVKAPAPSTTSKGSMTPVNTTTLTCSSSLGEGTFQSSATMTLECTSASDIHYCVSEDTCCDPLRSGVRYTSSFSIGAEAKSYCVSFVGIATDARESVVYQKHYTFDPTIPQLSVAHPKTFYQTTQLRGIDLISSSQFGASDLLVGQINFRSHDPGPSGLNLSCEEIITDWSSVAAPAPVETLAPFDVRSISPTDMIEVSLPLSRLSYGQNFIATYARSAEYVDRNSCSTTLVVLQDFAYFSAETSHGDATYQGGFSPYGFFEAEAQLNRTPAGVSTQVLGDHELHSGFLSLFY